MRNHCFCLLLLFAWFFMPAIGSCQQGGDFIIRGHITSLSDADKIVFSYENSTDVQYKGVSDTVDVTGSRDVTGGQFVYQGTLHAPTAVTAYLVRNGMRVDAELSPESTRYFFLDKGTITMEGNDLKTAAINGCEIEETWEALQAKTSGLKDGKEKENAYLSFVRANPDSYISWAMVKKYRLVPAEENETAMKFFNAMSERMKNSMDGRKFLKTRERLGGGAATIGRVAPDFSRNDVNGRPVALSSLRGKYVFLEFWASWCGPCRAESPYVKKAYELYKRKNFEVLAVSFDEKRKSWLDAIAEDRLPWIHVSSLSGLKNDDVSIMYGVSLIPRNFLLDPHGVIIAMDLRGTQLEEKLGEVMGAVGATKEKSIVAGDSLVVKGNVRGDTKGYNKIYVYGRGVTDDSASISNGSFELKIPYQSGILPILYGEYDVKVSGMYRPFRLLADRPGVVYLTDADINKGLSSGKWKGIKSAEDYQELEGMLNRVNEEGINMPARDSLLKIRLASVIEDYVRRHPDSYASAFALSSQSVLLSIGDVEKIYKMLSPNRQQSREGKNVSGYIAGVRSFSIGNYVKDFTLPTPEDKALPFSSLKGKYVLIDFWASWCGPCKESFPAMKELYKKYKSDRFEIYSISIDNNKAAWLKELKVQALPWLHALDTKNISKRVFAITAVPSTYLIDPEGKIIMKEVGYDPDNGPLAKKLHELLEPAPASTPAFSIRGKIDVLKEAARVVLQYSSGGKRSSDTVPLVNGEFSLKGFIDQPCKSTLAIISNNRSKDGVTFYLDKGEITISGATLKTAMIKGSSAQEDYEALQRALQPYYDKQATVRNNIDSLSPGQYQGAENDRLHRKLQKISIEIDSVQYAFIRSYLNSYVSWDLLIGKRVIENPDMHKALLYGFDDRFLKSKAGKEAIARLETALATAIGHPAPDFTQNNTEGVPVSLPSFRGKYILLEFWASWCGPCRAENPNLKNVYSQLKGKNFEIVAVSLDTKKDAWLKAISDDGLPWIHVSDLKGWNNELVALYNVQAVPHNLLIDPNGVIIYKNLRGGNLAQRLRELMGQPMGGASQ